MSADPLSPQWEACKVCGGDHWTKDHPLASETTDAGHVFIHRQFEVVCAVAGCEHPPSSGSIAERLARALVAYDGPFDLTLPIHPSKAVILEHVIERVARELAALSESVE